MGNMGPAAGQITFLVIHACTQSLCILVNSHVKSIINAFIHSFVHSFTCSLARSLTHSLTHSCISSISTNVFFGEKVCTTMYSFLWEILLHGAFYSEVPVVPSRRSPKCIVSIERAAVKTIPYTWIYRDLLRHCSIVNAIMIMLTCSGACWSCIHGIYRCFKQAMMESEVSLSLQPQVMSSLLALHLATCSIHTLCAETGCTVCFLFLSCLSRNWPIVHGIPRWVAGINFIPAKAEALPHYTVHAISHITQ